MRDQLFIDGKWIDTPKRTDVRDKYTDEVIAEVAVAGPEQVEAAVAAAERAAPIMAALPAHRRAEVLHRTAALIAERREDFARTIAREAGKAIKFARAEVDRAVQTFTFGGEEAKRIHGETVPLDAVPSGEGYFGF